MCHSAVISSQIYRNSLTKWKKTKNKNFTIELKVAKAGAQIKPSGGYELPKENMINLR